MEADKYIQANLYGDVKRYDDSLGQTVSESILVQELLESAELGKLLIEKEGFDYTQFKKNKIRESELQKIQKMTWF